MYHILFFHERSFTNFFSIGNFFLRKCVEFGWMNGRSYWEERWGFLYREGIGVWVIGIVIFRGNMEDGFMMEIWRIFLSRKSGL